MSLCTNVFKMCLLSAFRETNKQKNNNTVLSQISLFVLSQDESHHKLFPHRWASGASEDGGLSYQGTLQVVAEEQMRLEQ